MTLDTSGALLEGMRFSIGNSTYTFPPDNQIVDSNAFAAITERAEYLVVVDSTDPSRSRFEIADSDLLFYWSRNEPGITRFDYDGYSNRWLPMPGSSPKVIGNLSNESRLNIPVPDPTRITSAPYSLYIDDDPRVVFTLIFIGQNDFSDPSLIPSLTVEVNSSGVLNFSAIDTISYKDEPVSFTGQSFTDRTKSKSIGSLPDLPTIEYRIFMNPLPASGQIPRIRIGYGPYLTPEQVDSESLLGSPNPGVVRWSVDTGRLKFAVGDVSANPGEGIYYDGVFIGSGQLPRHSIPSVHIWWPDPAFNIPDAAHKLDSMRFIIFAEKDGESRVYFGQTVYDFATAAPTEAPTSGWCYIDYNTGNFYLSHSDINKYDDWTFGYVDSMLVVGAPGVGIQMRRSGANSSGVAVVYDFIKVYSVTQTITDKLTFPFLMLPTVPIVDSYLKFEVTSGSGSYVGELVNSSDPTKRGLGYLLDLDTKRVKFTTRITPRAYRLPKAQSSIKLDGAALSNRGVQVKRDGVYLSPSEFDLDVSAGVIEFVEPVGEGDINSRSLTGSTTGNIFTSYNPILMTDIGKRLLVESGANAGIYDIISIIGAADLVVSPSFIAHESNVSASVRATDEIIADRLWTPVTSVPKKFSIYRSPSGPSGTFTKLSIDEYSVKQNVGQVDITSAAAPGESIKIEYISLDSTDGGVTTVSTSRTEMALFKISQESVSYWVGSKVLAFNSSGRTVNTSKPIVLYIEGITQDSTSYTFTAPGTLTCKDAIVSGPVTIDYWVEEAAGGETGVNLLYYPIDYDALKVTGPVPGGAPGQTEMYVSGDQTTTLKVNCALLIDDRDVLYISSSSYDSLTDLTRVGFTHPVVEDGTSIKVTEDVLSSYLVAETNAVGIFVSKTNVVRIYGDVRESYKAGTIIDIDGYPYLVRGVSYSETTGISSISTAASAIRNFITPIVRRTIRPVFDPSSDFSTSRPAYITRGFTLAKMGAAPSILTQGVDYDLGDDGIIKLKTRVTYGDMLRAMYVARVFQPEGTIFEFNFAYEVAPSDSNGLYGQKLNITYNLYAPDTFFYRVETVLSMLPEAKEVVTSSKSVVPSGPNISSLPSQQTKDSGGPSPFFDAFHYGNLDVVVLRFLKYYHDLIEIYENLFSRIDGRIVGGSVFGRFRYDGNKDNVIATNYSEIKNDIDDTVVLYYQEFMSGSQIPILGKMFETNNLSRLFPTSKTGSAYIKSIGSDTMIGSQVGNFNVKNIVSVDTTTTSRAVAYFTSSLPISGGTQFTLDASTTFQSLINTLTGNPVTSGTNGESSSFTPPFKNGQKIQVFDFEGNQISDGVILDVDPVDQYLIYTSAITFEQVGSIVQTQADFEGDKNQQNMYVPGIDYTVVTDSGKINYLKFPLTWPFQNNPLVGNETIQAPIVFGNTDAAPYRFPALDGSELDDAGRVPIPRKRNACELFYLLKELISIPFGHAVYALVGGPITNIMTDVSLSVGTIIQFVNGPNSGIVVTISSIVSNTAYVTPTLPNADTSGSDFILWVSNYTGIVDNEISILYDEILDVNMAIDMFGPIELSGFGDATTTNTWIDMASDFTGMDGMLLNVIDGPSRGLYKIESALNNSVTISSDPYPQLIIGSGSYSIVEPWTFLKEAEFEFIAWFYRKTLEFLQATETWRAFPTFDGIPARIDTIKQRQIDLGTVIGDSGSLTNLLRNGDNLYDTRYLWINQRTNRESGLVQLQARAIVQAASTISDITENQRKAFLMNAITAMTG